MSMLVLGLILFVLLVVVHEYGHFLVAKRNGVEAEEFGIGFPPKIYGRTMGRGVFRGYYSINMLPLGGFVRLKGEHDMDDRKGSFGNAKLPAKIKIMLAGVFLNLVVALLMFTVVAWVGMPQMVENQFTVASDSKIISSKVIASYIDEGSPAQKSGLKAGDIVTAINGQSVNTTEELRSATKSNAGETVKVEYTREGNQGTTFATLLTDKEVSSSLESENPKGYLGVATSEYQLARSTWSAPIVAVGVTTQFTGLTLKGLASAVGNLLKSAFSAITGQVKQAKQQAGAAGENVAGPIGIYFILKQGSSLGIQFILFVIAIISLTLAIINALPIPALDGGRVAVTLIYRGLRKPLLPKTEERIHQTGFSILMLLFVLVTIVDVKRFL